MAALQLPSSFYAFASVSVACLTYVWTTSKDDSLSKQMGRREQEEALVAAKLDANTHLLRTEIRNGFAEVQQKVDKVSGRVERLEGEVKDQSRSLQVLKLRSR